MPIEQKICTRCIMDSSVPYIRFDENGECNYCKIQDSLDDQYPLGKEGEKRLNRLLERIKKDGENDKYDCIVGVSGGTDSTYTLYLTKKFGLRPLAVTYDNGWGTEISANNIKNAIDKLKVDLFTFDEDWGEFKELQKAFFRASTPDVEVISDARIKYTLYKVASDNNIRYIINGHSFRTEGKIPPTWSYGDSRYIYSVNKRFGKNKLKTIKIQTLYENLFYSLIKKIKIVRLLDYFDYSKERASKFLEKKMNWKDYGGHHYESIITRFCYSYYLPKKFNIDKRRSHFSARVRSGQMTREAALQKIKELPISEKQARDDIKYIIKKLEFTDSEFERILKAKPKTFLDYPNNYNIIYQFRKPIKFLSKFFLTSTPYTLFLMDHAKLQRSDANEKIKGTP